MKNLNPDDPSSKSSSNSLLEERYRWGANLLNGELIFNRRSPISSRSISAFICVMLCPFQLKSSRTLIRFHQSETYGLRSKYEGTPSGLIPIAVWSKHSLLERSLANLHLDILDILFFFIINLLYFAASIPVYLSNSHRFGRISAT